MKEIKRSACANAISSCFSDVGRLGEGEENDFLAGDGAEVVVHRHDLDVGDPLDHRLNKWTGGFDQMGPDLLQQVAALFGGKRLSQLLLGPGQDSLNANDEKIAE